MILFKQFTGWFKNVFFGSVFKTKVFLVVFSVVLKQKMFISTLLTTNYLQVSYFQSLFIS